MERQKCRRPLPNSAQWRKILAGAAEMLTKYPLRGGGWNNPPENLQSTIRNRNEPDNRNDDIGFRVAVSPANTPARTAVQATSWRFGAENHGLPALVEEASNVRASLP